MPIKEHLVKSLLDFLIFWYVLTICDIVDRETAFRGTKFEGITRNDDCYKKNLRIRILIMRLIIMILRTRIRISIICN